MTHLTRTAEHTIPNVVVLVPVSTITIGLMSICPYYAYNVYKAKYVLHICIKNYILYYCTLTKDGVIAEEGG